MKSSNGTTSTSYGTSHSHIDPIFALLMPDPEKFSPEYDETNFKKDYCLDVTNEHCSVINRWWNVQYKCQQTIIHSVEQPLFHTIIIVLVLIDCVFVKAELFFDFLILHKACHSNTSSNYSIAHNHHNDMETAIKVLEYSSLAILTVFVIELFVKVYAYGRFWWNLSERKMEWIDAIIVLLSYVIGFSIIYQNNVFAKTTLLVIFLRLWRSVRIIHSIVHTLLFQHEQKKKRLFTSYHELVEIFLTLSERKTAILSKCADSIVVEKCEVIDHSCRAVLQQCTDSSSLSVVDDLTHDLQNAVEEL
ncbi:unnamed protein product [Adineta ricciae]|uniref:Voltage-gated hydrogen channel 1 n=1 Tax=Adineta ricciae TaxID=249248 RepID=A0A814VLH1_ADIRI|nr:unnamed protein product [Adineta ricciae]CAF1190008.1 unnamed protein product [Adineta ricciae]